jgi:hypothetical protein
LAPVAGNLIAGLIGLPLYAATWLPGLNRFPGGEVTCPAEAAARLRIAHGIAANLVAFPSLRALKWCERPVSEP